MVATISVEEFRNANLAGRSRRGLDVRSAAEFATGHVPGTINVPMEQVEARMPDIPDEPLVLICEAGKRAEVVAGWLAEQREVTVLEGGVRSWKKAGYPVVACAVCRWSIERQVRFGAGLLVLIGALLAVFADAKWVYLPMFIGAGLTFAGLTNICGMAILLAKMPWNSRSRPNLQPENSLKPNCCS